MANVKITELPNLTNPSTTDVMPVVDVDADVTKKVSVGEVVGKISGDVDVATDGTSSIAAGAIVDADVNDNAAIAVSKLASGTSRQLLQTDAVGTGVEWTSSIDLPGTLDVTNATTLDSTLGVNGQSTLASAAVSDLTEDRVVIVGASGELEDSANLTFNGSELGITGTLDVSGNATIGGDLTVVGNLTVEGETTTIETTTLLVEDKNIEMGVVGTPSDATADGGGITLKGATDKTINWVAATGAWTFSEHIDIASAKEFRIAGTKVLDATTLGSGVVNSSLTSVGTIATGTWQGTAIDAAYLDATVVTTSDTGTVTSAMIENGTIVNDDINASAAIADTKLDTISTAGKVNNSATTATDANTASAIVARDASGDFSAGTITANLTGNSDTATALSSARAFAVTGDVTGTVNSDLTSGASIATSIAAGVIVNSDINASAAIAVSKLASGTARQLLQTDSAGTGVEWTDDVYIVGTLAVGVSAAQFSSQATIKDDLEIRGSAPQLRFYENDSTDQNPWLRITGGDLIFEHRNDDGSLQAQLAALGSTGFELPNGKNFTAGTATGTKIGTATNQKLGFFNATPVVQPTTSVAEAAFVENSGGTAINVDSTFGGYTIQQVVEALQALGLLA